MKKTAVISKFMRVSIKQMLENYYDIFELSEHPSLPRSVCTHPDMQMLLIGDELVCAQGCEFDKCTCVYAERELECKYPRDVGLNACLISGKLFANTNSLDRTVHEICRRRGIDILHVNQGYAKCSTLVLEKALISADIGIVKTAKCEGLDALLISPGGIGLDGYDYGFIGGASHYDAAINTVFFYGDISSHPDCEIICDFITSHGAKFVCADLNELYDYGGAVLI